MKSNCTLAIKIDVDTERGTQIGITNLLALFKELGIPATFLFSLGPDNTGKAIKRIFRPGFLKKVSRTSVVKIYGWRTLLNGVLLPAPHIGRRQQAIIRSVAETEHEVGIHCYDHIHWQDGLAQMSQAEVSDELAKALQEFKRIFGFDAKTAGAAGWQANAYSLSAYDAADFLYGSDTRGTTPFFPMVNGQRFKTLQIPTTLPALDELLGRPEFPDEQLSDYYLALLKPNRLNVWTIHAEIEGMFKLTWFKQCLIKFLQHNVNFQRLDQMALNLLKERDKIPYCEMQVGTVDGRSGNLATQGVSAF